MTDHMERLREMLPKLRGMPCEHDAVVWAIAEIDRLRKDHAWAVSEMGRLRSELDDAVAVEREACAKLVEEWRTINHTGVLANCIRARGRKT
jgi:hypothetical protein